MRQLFNLLRSLFYASAFFLLWGWLAVSVRRYDSSLGVVLPGWLVPVGFGLIVIGCVLAGTCVAWFATAGEGTPAPFDAPRRFVARGPYRVVRNPMYWGGFAIVAGFGLTQRSLAVLLLAGFMMICAHTFVVLYEEPALQRQFGEEYREYRRLVPRWLPQRQASVGTSSGMGSDRR